MTGSSAQLSIGHVFGRAWQTFKSQPLFLILGFIGFLILSIALTLGMLFVVGLCVGVQIPFLQIITGGAPPSSLGNQMPAFMDPSRLSLACISVFVAGSLCVTVALNLFGLGLVNGALTAVRGFDPGMEDIKKPFLRFGPLLGVVLLEILLFGGMMALGGVLGVSLSTMLGMGFLAPVIMLVLSILLVILMIGLTPALLLVMEYQSFSPMDALRASWGVTNGAKGRLFLLWIVMGLLAIPFGLIPFGLGSLLYTPYTFCLFAVMYDELIQAV